MAFIRGIGPAASNSTGAPLVIGTPARFPGDIVLITVVTAFPNDPSGVPVGVSEVTGDRGLTSLKFVGDTKYRFRVLGVIITAGDDGGSYTLTRFAGVDTGTDTIFSAKAIVVGGVVDPNGIVDTQATGTYTAAAGAVPALAAPGAGGLDILFGLSVTPNVSATPPLGYAPVVTETMGSGLGAGFSYYSASVSTALATVPSTFPASPANGRYAFISFALATAPSPTMPATAPAALLRMGCATSYQAMITAFDPLTATNRIIDAVGWQTIQWSRVLDDISTASVTIPDHYGGVFCCAGLGGLVPWRFGLRIERNDELVWEGPVVNVSRPNGDRGALPTLRVDAEDLWARYRKRLATHTVSVPFTNVDAGFVFASVQAAATYSPTALNGFALPFPIVNIGTGITREIVARNFEYAWDIMKDLLDAAVDGYIMNGVEYIFQPGSGWMFNDATGPDQAFDGPHDSTSGELLYGLFTEAAFRDRPGWSISGQAQANQTWEPGADTGEEGARRFWTAFDLNSIDVAGVLDFVDPNPLYRSTQEGVIISDATFQRRADSLIQLRSQPPAVISGGSLSDDAPVDMENLRPGAIWRMDIYDSCYGQLLANGRLKRVTVDVSRDGSGLTETVAPTIFPVGYTEANLE